VLEGVMSQEELEERYNWYVIKADQGCWEWFGHKHNYGYGQFRLKSRKYMYAHRASWIIHFGEIPKGMHVLHKCDNPVCSNPDHLFLGTAKDNMLDAIKKRRHPTMGKSGEENHMSKLTKEQVLGIRKMVSSGFKHKPVAEKYGISVSHVSTIVQHTCWRELR
jgi:hypothetical protein